MMYELNENSIQMWKKIRLPVKGTELFADYEKFLAINLFSPRTTLDSTDASNVVPAKKLIVIIAMRLLALFFTIRAAIAVTLPKNVTKSIICEFFQFYGNPTPIHIGLSAGAVCGCLLCGNPFQYLIYRGRSKIFDFLTKVKHNSLEYKLNERSKRKFAIQIKVISFLCLQFGPNCVLAIIYWLVGIIAVNMKENYNLFGNYCHSLHLVRPLTIMVLPCY